ncbi:MAG: hypothetical protein ACRDWD_17860, partial [Acidimicrobiia bacterium]
MSIVRRGGLGLMAVALVTAGLAFAVADPHPKVAAAAGRPKIFLYGDSIAWEARDWFKDMINISGGAAKIRTFPGADLCAWLSHIRSDVRRPLASAAVLEFGGVGLASCLDHAGEGPTENVLQEYREDTAKVTRLLARFGLRAYWVAPPGPVGAAGPSWMFPVFRKGVKDAGYDGATVVDGGKQLRKRDTKKYTLTRPCLQFETSFHGCDARRRIIVRNPDGGHFCPVPDFVDCPMYSSGAWRFSKNMAANPVPDLGLTPGLFREVADAHAAEAAVNAPAGAPTTPPATT